MLDAILLIAIFYSLKILLIIVISKKELILFKAIKKIILEN